MNSIINSHKLAIERLEIARNTLQHLANLIHESGPFIYKYDHETRTRHDGYNVLRHCGCIWALNYCSSEAISLNIPKDNLLRAINWLLQTHVTLSPGGLRCIATEKKVKLGASALAVVALSTLPNGDIKQYNNIILDLCNYIASQWCEDSGDFHHCCDLPSWEVNGFQSDYYTGQALLALLLAEEAQARNQCGSNSVTWTRKLAKNGYGIAVQSHWMMYAVSTAIRREASSDLLGYAVDFVDQVSADSSYRVRQQCTPIACRTEALAQFVAVAALMGRGWEYERVRRAIEEIEWNLEMQLNDYRSDGAFVCGGGRTHVRIDFLQHNAVAMIEHARSLSSYIAAS